MVKKLSYEEQFKRFKEEYKEDELRTFFQKYVKFKDIEEGLVAEKKKQWAESAKGGEE